MITHKQYSTMGSNALRVILAGLVLLATAGAALNASQEVRVDHDAYFFYSPSDRERIRTAAETPWGQVIVQSMIARVEERLKHDLGVPEQEAGHYHHYFCPEHKQLLKFDWDRPHEHWCPECKAYLTGERYDYAWIRMVHSHNAVFLSDCTYLHMITGDTRYLRSIRDMLLDYAGKYPEYEMHGHDMKPGASYGGKMFCQSLDEANWIVSVAPAYLEAKAILTAKDAEAIATGLLRPCAEVILGHRAGGNWQVWHNAGLASIAVALEDGKLLDTALEDRDCGYERLIDTGVTDEGWWEERSPGYHFYPLHAMLYTAEAVQCRGIDLYDARLKKMFTGPVHAVYPDLRFPAHNDGWYGTSLPANASLYEVAALRFNDPFLVEVLRRCYARVDRNSPYALLHGVHLEPDLSPLPLASCLYPDTGVAYLRDGVRTVVLKYGPHGGGHGHPDKLSIAVHDGKREVAMDLGTSGYGMPDYLGWYKKTLSHSTVLVDGADQAPATGQLIRFEPASGGGLVEAECAAAYEGLTMRRRLQLTDGALEDHFTCTSEVPHAYEYVLILAEPPACPQDARDAELPATAGHDRIKQAKTWQATDKMVATTKSLRIELAVPGTFTVTTGEAPGAPANPWDRASPFAPCHPLIVRTEGSDMTVEAQWTFLDGEPTQP